MGEICSTSAPQNPINYKELYNQNEKKRIRTELDPDMFKKGDKFTQNGLSAIDQGQDGNLDEYLKQKEKYKKQIQRIKLLQKQRQKRVQMQKALVLRGDKGEQLTESEAAQYKQIKQRYQRQEEQQKQKAKWIQQGHGNKNIFEHSYQRKSITSETWQKPY